MVALSGFFSSLPLPHLVFVILTLWKGSETWEASTFPKERGFELTLGGGEEAAFGCHSQGVTKPFLPFFPRCPSSGRKLRQLVPLGTSGGHKLGLSHSTLFLSGLTLLEENRQFPASYLLQCVCVCVVCVCVCTQVCVLSHFWLLAIPWTVVHQDLLFVRFSRQEYWSGLPLPSPGYRLNTTQSKPQQPCYRKWQADSVIHM